MRDIIKCAWENGVNFIDTAEGNATISPTHDVPDTVSGYAGGQSEREMYVTKQCSLQSSGSQCFPQWSCRQRTEYSTLRFGHFDEGLLGSRRESKRYRTIQKAVRTHSLSAGTPISYYLTPILASLKLLMPHWNV